MKMKRNILMVLIVFMAVGCLTTFSVLAMEYEYIYLRPENFQANRGSWTIIGDEKGEYGGATMRGQTNASIYCASALAAIEIPKDGTYYVYARTRDFTQDQGKRMLRMAIDEKRLTKTLGAHGVDGYSWEFAGEMELKAGKRIVSVIDYARYYGRVDVIVITNDPAITLPQTHQEIFMQLSKYQAAVSQEKLKDPLLQSYHLEMAVPKEENMNFNENREYYFLTPDSFKNHLGSWSISSDNEIGGFQGRFITPRAGEKSSAIVSAKAKIKLPRDGIYRIWVRTRDFENMAAIRPFKIGLDNAVLEEVFGVHTYDGWLWEYHDVAVFKGEHVLSLIVVEANFARCDLLLITDDMEFVPSHDNAKLEDVVKNHLFELASVIVEEDMAAENNDVIVMLNNKKLDLSVHPVIIKDTLMVPIETICIKLGYSTQWDGQTGSLSLQKDGCEWILSVGERQVKMGKSMLRLECEPVLIDGVLFAPLRFVFENLGALVDWDDMKKTVKIIAKT